MTDKEQFSIPAGLYQVGVCVGISSNPIQTQMGPRQRYEIGLRDVADKWGDEKIVEIRIPESAVNSGILPLLESYRGRMIAVPVWVQTWQGKKGPGSNLMVSTASNGAAKIIPLDAAQ